MTRLRELAKNETKLLESFLYEAIFIPEGVEPPDRSIIEQPELKIYYEGFGTSGMSFVEKPPYFGCPNGRIGLLSSMFTDPDYRRKGIAKELLSRVVEEARNYGCGTVQITASDMGVKLYTAYGFVHNGNFMHYKL